MSALIAFILNNTVARWVAISLLTLGGLWYVNKLSVNHAYEQGRIEGGKVALEQVEKINLDEWKTTRDAIAKQQANLKQQKAALLKQRDNIEQQLGSALTQLEKKKESAHNEALQVDTTDLVPRIRELLDELRGGVDSSPSHGLSNPGPGTAGATGPII